MGKKIWVVHNPGKIYTNIAKNLKDTFLIINKKFSPIKEVDYYSLKANTEIFKFLLFPIVIKNRLSKKKTKISRFPIFIGIKKLFEKHKPKVIITNFITRPYTWQAARYCNKNNTPLIITTEMKGFADSLNKRILQKLLLFMGKNIIKESKFILSWTSQGVKFWTSQFPEYKNKINLMPAGVDTNIFYPVKSKKNKELNILMVARFVSFKRHIDMLKACKILKEKGIDFKLNLLGEGPLKEDIKNKLDEMGLKENIRFLEKVSYERVKEIYSSNDILVLPSYNEPIGMVVPEAMACKTPCVVSDTSGATTYVEDGKNGFIFKTYDIRNLADKIIKLKDRKDEFGKKSEKHIKENFSIEKVSRLFEKYIEETENSGGN